MNATPTYGSNARHTTKVRHGHGDANLLYGSSTIAVVTVTVQSRILVILMLMLATDDPNKQKNGGKD